LLLSGVLHAVWSAALLFGRIQKLHVYALFVVIYQHAKFRYALIKILKNEVKRDAVARRILEIRYQSLLIGLKAAP